MNNDSILLRPLHINGLEIPNRFVRSSTHEFLADREGNVTDRLLNLLADLAEGEVGLILTGHTYVLPGGQASPRQLGVYSDDLIPGLNRITDRIHRYPSRIFLQISHAGRQTKEKLCGRTPVAPSAVYEPNFDMTPREMSAGDIHAAIDAFIQGGRRAQEAGFDGVQLPIAHGYLLSSFISPYTHRRIDEWGGPLENRIRIILEIIRGIRALTGPAFPLIVKLNSTDFLEGGLSLEESLSISQALEREGIDGIEVSGGMAEAGKGSVWKGLRSEEEEGYFVDNAALIKEAVGIPVFGLGGLRTFAVMEDNVAKGRVDLISMSRPFIREPHLVKKFRQGLIKKSECISCNLCFNPRGISCGALKNKE